jgi:ParB family chromosome partitioning protein
MVDKKRGLGRSLGDLLGASEWLQKNDIQVFYCPIERLHPNPYQPRRIMHDDHLEDLANSIREKGILQPILVTRTEVPDDYQILAGERRCQAAKLAGLSEVPVIMREASSPEVLELALIENIQRRDLNCIEEALAYQRLHEEFHLTQEEIADRVGKNRSTVANLLRILLLPADIQEDVLNERLSMGHARALLSLDSPEEQRKLRDLILTRNLSVRQTEQMAARGALEKPEKPPVDSRLAELQESLQSTLGARVVLRRRGKKGSITIAFDSDDHLEELLKRFGMTP